MATFVKGDAVPNASGYELLEKVGETYNSLATASEINFEVSAMDFAAGDHLLAVKAKGDGVNYSDSDPSETVTYTVEEELGEPIEVTNLISNGDFTSADGWSAVAGGTLTVENGVASVYHEGATGTACGVQQGIDLGDRGQKTGDIFFACADIKAETYTDVNGISGVVPNIQLMLNSAGGVLYAFNSKNAGAEVTAYGTATLTADSATKLNFYPRAQYSKTEYVAGKTCTFDNVVLVNLTETYGAGNEPTADAFYALVKKNGGYINGTETIQG